MHELTPYVARHPSPVDHDMPPAHLDPMSEMDERPGLQYYWSVIRKHRALIAIFFLGTLCVAAITLILMPRTYTAATTLLIERNTPQVLDFREVIAESLGAEQYDFYKTQYEILRSRALAARVIHTQQLEANPILTGEWQNEGF